MYSQPYTIQRPRIDKLLALALGLVAILVMLFAILPARVVSSVLEEDAILTQRLDPMAATSASILNLMVDQETGERGYVITADESFLEPYNGGRGQLESLWPVAEAQALAVSGRAPALLAAVRRSALTWQAQAAEVEIADVRSGYQQDALSAVGSGRSRTLFTQFRNDSEALSRYVQERQVAQTSMRDQELARLRQFEIGLVGFGLLALGLLAYAGLRYVSLLRRVVLAESEARFRNIVETANEGVWLIGDTGQTLLANQRMAELLGVGLNDLAASGLLDFCFPEDLPSARQRIQQNLRGQADQSDERLLRRDGSTLHVLASTSPMRNAAGHVIGVLGMFSDITARRQAEEERLQLLERVQEAHETVEAARQRLAVLAEASRNIAAAGIDLQPVVTAAARQVATIMGGACVLRLVNQQGDSLPALGVFHPEPDTLRSLQPLVGEPHSVAEGVDGRVFRTRRPLRIPFSSEDAATPLDPAAQAFIDRFAIQSLLVVPVQVRERVLGTLSIWRTTPNRPYSVDDQVLLQDLADRIALALENARLYGEAVDALKMRDHFLSAVSHDLRSPLTTARGTTQMVMRQLTRQKTPESLQLADSLAAVERATGRMTQMIAELLDIARLRAGRPLSLNRRRTDLVALIQQLASEHQQLPGKHRIVIEANVPAIIGSWDSARMERVLTNLLSNAVKYSPDGGAITVSVSEEQEGPAGHQYAMLQVRDQGLGIPPADLPHIFEPFHRGSNVENIAGVGIGLAGAKQIVEQHGGTLTVNSQQGRGAVFSLRLPIDVQEIAEDSATLAPGRR